MVMKSYGVVSSAIKRLAYDDESEECEVTFKDGRSYVLRGLAEIEFHRWAESESVGGYWNSFVKGNY